LILFFIVLRISPLNPPKGDLGKAVFNVYYSFIFSFLFSSSSLIPPFGRDREGLLSPLPFGERLERGFNTQNTPNTFPYLCCRCPKD
jgi:hypothetical protein